jgi:hypothetical protein
MCGRNITCPDLSVPNVEHPPRNHGLVGDETTYLEYSNGAIEKMSRTGWDYKLLAIIQHD